MERSEQKDKAACRALVRLLYSKETPPLSNERISQATDNLFGFVKILREIEKEQIKV